MSDFKIVLTKENIISLVDSFYNTNDDILAYSSIMNFFYEIGFWRNNDAIDPKKTIGKQINNKKAIIDGINNIKNPTILDNYNFIKFKSIDKKILLNFSEKEENTLCILDTLKSMVKEDELSIIFANMYLEMVNIYLINPLENKKSLTFFDKIAKQSFNSENIMQAEEIKELKEKALSIIFDQNFDIEKKKEYFCQYIESTEINLDNKYIKHIYEKLKYEDFSMFYKDYYVIRDFYQILEEDCIVKSLFSTKIQFNIPKNADNLKLEHTKYSKILEKGHFYAVEKSREILEIENCIDMVDKNTFTIYINSYDNNDITKLFISKYKKFLELLPETYSSELDCTSAVLKEQWDNISLFVEINNKMPEKNITKKKKV